MPLTPKEQEVAELLLDEVLDLIKEDLSVVDINLTTEAYKNLMEGARNRTDMQMAEWAVEQQKLQMQLQAQGLAASLQHGKPKGPVSYGG